MILQCHNVLQRCTIQQVPCCVFCFIFNLIIHQTLYTMCTSVRCSGIYIILDTPAHNFAFLGPTARLVVVIFNHLAPHNCRITVPTGDRLDDRELVKRSELFVDAVYWQGDIYDCPANRNMIQQCLQLFNEQ